LLSSWFALHRTDYSCRSARLAALVRRAVFEPLIIAKMILAAILTGLLVYAVVLHRRNAEAKSIFLLYALCLACAIGLGFSGGELVYGN